MDILKGYRKITLTILACVTAIISALVGDLTVTQMVDAIVKICLGFFGANGVEHLAGILGKKK